MDQTVSTPRPKIKYKSFKYHTHLDWLGDRAGMLQSEGKPQLRIASPPEFKGEAGVWTPEELFVAAVETCTMTTFAALSQKLELPVVSYTSHAEGTLEFVDGGYRFTKIVLRPNVVIAAAAAVEQTRRTLHEAHKKCLIANSICTDVSIEAEIAVNRETLQSTPAR